MSRSSLSLRIIGLQMAGVIIVNALLSALYFGVRIGAVHEPPPPNAVPGTWPSQVTLVSEGMWLSAMVGGMTGVLIGVVTGCVLALTAASLPYPPVHRRRQSFLMQVVALGAGLWLGRFGTALLAYWLIDFNWDLGWNRADFPTWGAFLELVVFPTILVGLSSWWAAACTSHWYLRTAARYRTAIGATTQS